ASRMTTSAEMFAGSACGMTIGGMIHAGRGRHTMVGYSSTRWRRSASPRCLTARWNCWAAGRCAAIGARTLVPCAARVRAARVTGAHRREEALAMGRIARAEFLASFLEHTRIERDHRGTFGEHLLQHARPPGEIDLRPDDRGGNAPCGEVLNEFLQPPFAEVRERLHAFGDGLQRLFVAGEANEFRGEFRQR